LQPDITLVTVQLGTQFESNPRYYLQPRRGEVQMLGSAVLLDERKLGVIRWRTDGVAAGVLHGRESDLTYGILGAETGPVLDAFTGWTFHPAVGGGAAYFDHRFYYGEGSASAMLNSSAHGVYRSISVRGAYRSYDEFFPSSNGFYVETRGKLAAPNILGSASIAVVSPWAVWSDISGTASVVTPIITELQPGAYLEWGSRLDLIKSITNWLVLGVNITASKRDYRNDVVITTGGKRQDTIVSPGISVTFPNLFALQSDLRFDYRYLMDRSNDPSKNFNDQIVTASVIARFDPTAALAGTIPER
jgi:hypothetical protein